MPFPFLIFLLAVVTSTKAAESSAESLHRLPPDKVLGAGLCAECHQEEATIWRQSSHYSTYYQMHRMRYGRRIASKLGYDRIKSDTSCIQCHYVARQEGPLDRPELISGISCESCHGAARDWNKAHSNPDDPNRLQTAERLGMIRPSNRYQIARACFECHIISNEELVNKGDHHTLSNFEMVAWMSGEVRHNVHHNHAAANPELDPGERRIMFLTGMLLDLEFSLRALSDSTTDGNYRNDILNHLKGSRTRMAAITKRLPLQELSKAASSIPVEFKDTETHLKDAQGLRAINQRLEEWLGKTDLTPLDDLLPSPSEYIGAPIQPMHSNETP